MRPGETVVRFASPRGWAVAPGWRSRSNMRRLQNGVVDVERASCAPRPFGEGFVDISMYVVLARPSKNAAGREPDNLRRIFRELRLAVFGRMCRLPIGLGSLWTCSRGRFPILRCRMSGIVSGILGRRGWRRAAVAPTAAAVFRPILGRGIVAFG